MSLFFAELRKVWGGRVFPALLAILAAANLLLLWMGTRPTAKQPPASAYRAVGAELSDKTMEEKGTYLHDKYTEIESLVKIGQYYREQAYGGYGLTQYRQDNAAMFDAYEQEYTDKTYTLFTDNLNTEYRLFSQLQSEYDTVAAYSDFLDSVQTKASQLSGISIFQNDRTGYDLKNIELTAQVYAGLTETPIDYYPQKGLYTAISYAFTDLILLASMLLLALILVRQERDSGLLSLIRSLPGGRLKTAIAKLAAFAASLLVVLMVLYGVNLAYCSASFSLGPMNRTIQSVPALTDKAKVSLKPEDGNSLFQILDNGLQISTGLTVLLGKRSSGKTYTLDQINAQFPGGKYIKQFSLLSTDDEQSQRKFEAALKNRGNSVTESYLGPFKTVVDDVQSVNLEQDAKEIDEYLETLKKAGEDAQRQDIFSKANLYQESNFSIKNLSSLVEMIEAVETLLGSIEYKELVEKYVGRRSLLRLAIALREQYIQEKTDSLHKEYVNSLITSVKKELSVRSSTTAVPDIDLYQILMNQHKVQVFHDVVKMIKKPRVIQAQNLYSYRVVAQSSPFSGALAMQKVSRSKTVFSDAFKEYNDPYKFLQVLKGKDIPASEYYKYFVNITYEVFNQYGSPASGGERSEYNLLQELSDGVKNSILILDEPESSFDNIFLRDGVDSLLKDISKTIPVIIATHNNTIGVSVHPDYIVYACKEVLSDGKLEYHLYSGYPSSEDLVDLKGNHISRKSVLLDCLEAGEAAYMDRRNSYEILNG